MCKGQYQGPTNLRGPISPSTCGAHLKLELWTSHRNWQPGNRTRDLERSTPQGPNCYHLVNLNYNNILDCVSH